MTILDYWRIFLRHRLMISLCAIISVALAVTIIIEVPCIWEAQCKILIVNSGSPTRPDAVLDATDLMLGTLGKSDPITTQTEFIQTRPIFSEVIKRCNLKDVNGLPAKEKWVEKKTTVTPIKGSNILQLTYRDHDSALAKKVLSTIALVAEEKNQELNRQEIRNMREFIEMQLDAQKAKLEKAEQATVNYKSKEKTVSIGLQTQSQINAAAEIKAEIVKLESQRQGVLAQKAQVEANLSQPGAQADPFYPGRLNMLEQINNQLSNIEAQKRALYSHLSIANKDLSSLPQEEINLSRHQRDEKITGDLYTDLLSKYNELEVKEAAKTASIKIIEPAYVADEPVFPQKKKLLSLALLFGLTFGCGMAFLREYLNKTAGSITEIKHILPYPVLGAIPFMKKKNPLFIKNDPASLASKNIRLIRSNMAFNSVYNEKNLSLLVTSAIAQEGKALISSNIALLYSSMGKRVVLVNFDFCRPLMDRMFHFQSQKGINEFLMGQATMQEIIHRNTEINLDIIDTGSDCHNPSDILSGDKLDAFFSSLESAYEIRIINGPPATISSEALDLTRRMKGIILVVDSSATSTTSLGEMQGIFQDKNLPIFGTVINMAGGGKIA